MFNRKRKQEEKQKNETSGNTKEFKALEPSNSLIIRILNDNVSECREGLGITLERYKELQQICQEALEKDHNNGRIVVMANISNRINHVNELYMCMLLTESCITRGSSSNFTELLSKLLGDNDN